MCASVYDCETRADIDSSPGVLPNSRPALLLHRQDPEATIQYTRTHNTGRRRSRHWSSSYTLCEHSLTDHYRRAGYYYHFLLYLHARTAHSDKLIVIGSLYHNNTVYNMYNSTLICSQLVVLRRDTFAVGRARTVVA